MKEGKWLAIVFGIGLLCALVFTGCDMSIVGENAKAPLITVQPEESTVFYLTSNEPSADLTLSVTAGTSDGGDLSYQWYSNTSATTAGGTEIPNATGSTYTHTFDTGGTYYFYVVITNTKSGKSASITSGLATITVNTDDSAAFPVITAQPAGGTFYIDPEAEVTGTLLVIAEVDDGGDLSYQWYSNTSASTAGGEAIEGATGSTYTVTITEGSTGAYYYYVVVTNYNDDPALENDTSTTTSNVVTINVPGTFNATFTVDTGIKYQYVRGFGGMDTAWNNVTANDIEDYEKMYHPGNPDDPGNTDGVNGLGYNIMRIMIMPWNTDIDITMLELTEYGREGAPPDRPDYYEGVKIVNKYGGYVLASPWSPPAEWKENNDIKGGYPLLSRFYIDFANYLNDFSRHMMNKGAPIYAISMQNEPSYAATTYDGCDYTPEQHQVFWQTVHYYTRDGGGGTEAAPTWTPLKPRPTGYGGGRERPYVLTTSGEAHNQPAWLNSVLMGSRGQAIEPYIDILGRHIYGSGVDADSPAADEYSITSAYAARWGTDIRNQREAAGKETWMSEHNINSVDATSYTNDYSWNYVWKFMNDIDLVIRMNSENAFIWWTSKRFYSMIGDNAYGTTEHFVLGRGFGLSHYAKFAKEMTRVALSYSGANADGTALSDSNINHPPVYNGISDGEVDTSFNVDSTTARATAFADFAEDGTVNAISLVMMTPTSTSGTGGQNMGAIKIQLPDGFTAGRAIAMRSTSENIGKTVTESVAVRQDGNAAYVSLPASNILSVKFFKAE